MYTVAYIFVPQRFMLPLTYNNDMVVLLIWVECAFKGDEFVLG